MTSSSKGYHFIDSQVSVALTTFPFFLKIALPLSILLIKVEELTPCPPHPAQTGYDGAAHSVKLHRISAELN